MISIEGQIVNIDKTSRGRIEIGDDGIISSVGKETGQADLVFQDELIFPGFIDLHVHARECADHSQDYKEDFISAGQAAINGGVVAFAEMPNNPVAPIDDKSYAEKKLLAEKCPVEVILYAGTNPGSKPFSVSFRANASEPRNPLNSQKVGVKGSLHSSDALLSRDDRQRVPYKVYISKSVGDLFFDSFEELEKFLVPFVGQSVSFHCEDPNILKASLELSTHEQRRPAGAEISAVDFALKMIEKYRLLGKICHCSTVEGLQKIIEAKKRGIQVTVEVTPHHLYFDESMITEANQKMFQVNPPIRQTSENRLALIQALKNGDIDFLATDHAPHSLEEKQKGMSGLTHLDTYGSFVTWLIKEHNFTAQEIMRVCSANPAKFINPFTSFRYGEISEGYVGSLTILDVNKPLTVTKEFLKTKAGWSPFEGVEFPGRAVCTVVKGKIYEN